jgi:rhamnose utilization protein RhaD (predicted bifunctional aldolase and dehydrogenase)
MASALSPSPLDQLLNLSHELGTEARGMAMLGEGNTSTRRDESTFWVKASGTQLRTLQPEQVVACRNEIIVGLMDRTKPATDEEVHHALLDSRIDPQAMKPSVEALFHGYLLSLPDVHFVGHVHAIAVNQILCSPRARDFAEKRIFPDEIVCCGAESVLVPYTDPGLILAQVIRDRTRAFIERHGAFPRLILLENHGIIALGKTPQAVLAALLMAEKTAAIWVGAAALGGPIFLTPENVQRIAQRPDEHYRQRALKL